MISLFMLTTISAFLSTAKANISASAIGQKYKTKVESYISVDEKTGVSKFFLEYTSDVNICHNSGDVSPIELEVVFVLGKGQNAKYFSYPMSVRCHNGNKAYFSFDSENGLQSPSWSSTPSDPYIWDKIFPSYDQGERWYAIRVGFIRSLRGAGIVRDNKDGEDYRLIFK